MTRPILKVDALAKTYADGTEAVRGIDFRVGAGVFGLLGENGAGKTTTMSMVALQVQPTSGTVFHRWLDASYRRNHAAIRRRLGFLPQSYEPVPSLDAWEYLTYCARTRGVKVSRRRLRERIGGLLEAVDLIGQAHRPAREYSGGMKRRLGICQALVHEPELVILDEPSAGLDPEQRILLRNFLSERGREQTVLLSSHIVDDIDQTCHEMVVLSEGRLVYQGAPSELLQRFAPHLWEVPEPARPERAAGPAPSSVPGEGHVLGFSGERAARVVYAERRPPEAQPRRPTLEEAYGALLISSRGPTAAVAVS